jgi:5-methylcytosine-specific restriction enzyme subunit McrC
VLAGLVVEIRPKVPISSVLFLVSYACDAAAWFAQQPELARDADLTEMLAIMLARLTEQATRRGLLNGYRSEDESLQAPRGRVLFDEQLRRWLGAAPPIEVRHDVFTSDIVENRLLLAGLEAMGRLPHRSLAPKREISRAKRLFGAVQLVRFPPAAIPEIVFTRLNRHYQPAVSLASLLLRSSSLELGAGGSRGSAFLIDMNVVFERFVRLAMRKALGADTITFPDRPPLTWLDQKGVVPLKPDLCLVRGGKVVWVGDAKYKRLPSGAYNNADLYQMLAYSVALGLSGGTLVYAAEDGVTSAEHVVGARRLRVAALDLREPPRRILQQIEAVARDTAARECERSRPVTTGIA